MLSNLTKPLELHDPSNYSFIKCVSIGTTNLHFPLTKEMDEEQNALLEKCLATPPRGRIISRDTVAVVYWVDGEYVRRELVTYHIGFKHKPYWLI